MMAARASAARSRSSCLDDVVELALFLELTLGPLDPFFDRA